MNIIITVRKIQKDEFHVESQSLKLTKIITLYVQFRSLTILDSFPLVSDTYGTKPCLEIHVTQENHSNVCEP